MATAASIVNVALARIGSQAQIVGLNEASPEARAASVVYDEARRVLILAGEWPWATTVASLAKVGDHQLDPHNGFLFSYALPVGCLHPIRIVMRASRTPLPEDRVPFSVEFDETSGALLYCDLDSASSAVELEYLRDVEDPNRLPADFRDALAWRLARELALALSVDDQKAQRAEIMAQRSLDAALARCYNGSHELEPESSLLSVR